LEQLKESGWPPGCSLVLGGFSQGGGLAAHLVCAGTIGVEGLVVVSPTFRDWGVPAVTDGRAVRSWILLGAEEHPRIAVEVEELGETLQSSGWPTEIVRLEGVGHAFPSDFDERLARALVWLGASDLT
jgi:predicted esterase